MTMNDGERDGPYVIRLCDTVLNEAALRGHRFDWLLGDPAPNGRRAKLAVEAYWPGRHLVVEYRETHHVRPTPHVDKPGRRTLSGVDRGTQRALYDARRDAEIPAHGLRFVVIRPGDIDADSRGKLRRNEPDDLESVRRILLPTGQR